MLINANKVTEVIQLTNDPDSPVLSISFTDSNLNKWMKSFSGKAAEMSALATEANSSKVMADTMGEVLSEMVGEDGYRQVLQYLGQGLPAEECNIAMLPVFMGLIELMAQRSTEIRSTSLEKYLRHETPTADIL